MLLNCIATVLINIKIKNYRKIIQIIIQINKFPVKNVIIKFGS